MKITTKKMTEIVLLTLMVISIAAKFDGILSIDGLSPSPSGLYGYSAALNQNGSLLAMGYSNATILIYQNNGTNYLFRQQILNAPKSDSVYFSKDSMWLFFSYQNILCGYRQVNGTFVFQMSHQCSWTYSSGSDTMRFDYYHKSNTIFVFRQQRNIIEVIDVDVELGSFSLRESIAVPLGSLITLKTFQTQDKIVFNNVTQVLFYAKNSAGLYQLESSLQTGYRVYDETISADGRYLVVGTASRIAKVYRRANNTSPFIFLQDLQTTNANTYSNAIRSDNQVIYISGVASSVGAMTVFRFIYNSQLDLFEPDALDNISLTTPQGSQFIDDIYIGCFTGTVGTLIFYECNVANCQVCSFAKYCSQCEPGATLVNGKCFTKTQLYCVDGKLINGVCMEYCSKQCLGCLGSPANCHKCSNANILNPPECTSLDNRAQILSYFLFLVTKIRSRKIIFAFLLLEDFKMYQYHRPNYQGTVNIIITALRNLQNRKQTFLKLQDRQFVRKIRSFLPNYSQFSNKKYLLYERKDISIPQNLVTQVLFEIPLSIVMFLFFHKLFQILYNYPLSYVFRLYSFNMTIVCMLIGCKIEIFSYLSLSTMKILHFQSTAYKINASFSIIYAFALLFHILCFHYFCLYMYKKLSRYFMDNLRATRAGAFFAMISVFGIRPLLRGIVHTIDSGSSLQLSLLSGIDLVLFLTLAGLQLRFKIYESKFIFVFECVYFLTSSVQNLSIIPTVDFPADSQCFNLFDDIVYGAVITKIATIALCVIVNLQSFLQAFYHKLCKQSKECQDNDGEEKPKQKKKNLLKIKISIKPCSKSFIQAEHYSISDIHNHSHRYCVGRARLPIK